jgi:N-acetylglucosaminyl-diphospho-decaprenol L-rhamnosyltransferase
VYHVGARAEHRGGGTTDAIKDRRLFHAASSRVAYAAKRHGPLVAIVLILFILVLETPIRWLYTSITRSPKEGWLVIRGMGLFWRHLSSIRIRARA